jgi:hypothetical protein
LDLVALQLEALALGIRYLELHPNAASGYEGKENEPPKEKVRMPHARAHKRFVLT